MTATSAVPVPVLPTTRSVRAISRLDLWLLGALYAFTALALAGFAVYGQDPARLAGLPAWAVGIYGLSFRVFAQGQVVLSAAALIGMLATRVGTRWLAAFSLLYGLSLASELAGTTWGVPFGAYRYTNGLGPAWLGRVPVLIPLSWFCMAIPSWALAGAVVGRRGSGARIVAGSLILLAWDLSLDPAMSWVTRYWVWSEAGPYYGMPLGNLLGWYVTGLALMSALAVIRADRWLQAVPLTSLAALYVANLLLPIGMNAVAGLSGAVAAGLAPIAVIAGLVVRGAQSRRRGRQVAGEAA